MNTQSNPNPLFYERPEVLNSARHSALRVLPQKDWGFTRAATSMPITAAEFAVASHDYPILFAGDQAHPVVALSLERGNVWLEADMQWAAGLYVPAYARRYPFILFEPDTGNGGNLLGIDMASDRVTSSSSDPSASALFEGEKATPFAQQALQFCSEFHADHRFTQAFAAAVIEQKLLVERELKAVLPQGRELTVGGFRVIDEKRFRELPESLLTAWHRQGWLDLICLHLASQLRWRRLLDRTPSGAAWAKV
jgi:hypothetical protein